jgi:hypothetical protein
MGFSRLSEYEEFYLHQSSADEKQPGRASRFGQKILVTSTYRTIKLVCD